MSLFHWLRRLGKKKQPISEPISPDDVMCDDPHGREVIAQAFNSGNIVTGFVDKSGKLHTKETPVDQAGG